jgi:TonB family protein
LETRFDINTCEKIRILNFIYKEFLPYAKTVKKTGPEYELWVFFNIEANGEIKEFEIREKAKSESTKSLRGIPLGKPYLPVVMDDFTGKRKFQAYYKMPIDLIPDFDYDQLFFSPEENTERDIFRVVEQMPRFPGCEEEKTEKQKEDCAKIKMLEYFYNNLEYPEEASIKGIEGQVVLQFIVETDGSITDIRVLHDIGYGCGQAAVDVVELWNDMPEKWRPGHQRGKPVPVLYILPVKFKLEE